MSKYTPGEHENTIEGYSIYKNKQGISEKYKGYDIFVKEDIKYTLINCQIGTDTMGASSNVAEIFPVSLSCGEKYIGKVIPYSVTPSGWEGIISEIKIQNRAADSCKVPKIIMYFLGPNNAVIIMYKIEGDTINSKLIEIIEGAKAEQEAKKDEAKKKISAIYESVKTSLETLHKAEIYHGDSHLENFMYESKDETTIWIIDFGHSSIDSTKINVKILEDYMCLRSAFTILSKSKTKDSKGKFVLKGYSIYLEDIIMLLNEKILELEKNVCVPCLASTAATVSMRRSKRQLSKRKVSKRKVSKRKVSERKVSKRKVSNRKSKRQVSKKKLSKRSRR